METLELPYPPPQLSPNKRLHWAQIHKIKKKYRSDCALLARQAKGGIKFRMTFHPPCKRRRDRDNIIASCKALQDGLADAWGIDDSQFEITYAPLGEPVKHGKVVIEILA